MTTLRRTVALMLSVSAVSLATGCTDARTSTATTLAPEPQAGTGQTIRNFEPTIASYANGDTVTGTTGFRYDTDEGAPSRGYVARDIGVYAANVVTMPYTLIADRDKEVVSQGLVIEPTYTAVPARPNNTLPEVPRPHADAVAPSAAPIVISSAPTTAPTTGPADAIVITPEPAPAVAPVGTFTILGHVSDPGRYDLKKEGVTLSQALEAAGLVQKDPTKVTVTLTEAAGTSRTFTLDTLTTATDPVIRPGDSIVVKIVP